ncbi:MAG: 50S ribosomal protein L6 [bacterium]
MSKVGKKIIMIPEGVEVTLDQNHLTVKGPKGTLSYDLLDGVQLTTEDGHIAIVVADEEKRNIWGLTRTLVANMVE